MESTTLQTRLGPLACRSSGEGPTVVFFAGALANGDLWRDVVVALEDHYRCITIDLPLGSHPWPLAPGRTGRPRRSPGCSWTAWTCWTSRTPRWSPTTPRAGCCCCRWPRAIRRSGAGPSRPQQLRELREVPARRAEAGVGDVPHPPRLARAACGCSCAPRSPGASSSPASPRQGWTRSARIVLRAGTTRPAGGRRPRGGHGGLPSAAAPRRLRGHPGLRPAGPAGLGRRVRLLPDHRRPAARVRRSPTPRCAPCPARRRGSRSTAPAAMADAIAAFVPSPVR